MSELSKKITIAIDCMGGDHGLPVTIPAAVSFVKQVRDSELILVGNEEQILAELRKHKAESAARLKIVSASEVVAMDDPVEVALRRKRDSSMRIAVNLVKEGEAQACVSAGNTGALMAISRYVLRTLPGIERPALCVFIPNKKNGATYMLDLGANVDCEPENLRQFALMASIFVATTEEKPNPTVGLLNIGEEDIKGNGLVKQTAALLRADHEKGLLNFYGNVEGDDIFKGTTDIIVCDGFVGNAVLKAVEGLASFFVGTLTAELKSSPLSVMGAFFARGAIKSFSRRMKPSRYNGSNLLGLRGLVFKSHGSADIYGYEWAIKRAFDAAKYDVLGHISASISEVISESQAAS